MQYRQLLQILEENADEKYRDFHKRLLKNDGIKVLGVRVPDLRKIAKQFKGDVDNLLSFPDEYYVRSNFYKAYGSIKSQVRRIYTIRRLVRITYRQLGYLRLLYAKVHRKA